jgi:hypothetical protein
MSEWQRAENIVDALADVRDAYPESR